MYGEKLWPSLKSCQSLPDEQRKIGSEKKKSVPEKKSGEKVWETRDSLDSACRDLEKRKKKEGEAEGGVLRPLRGLPGRKSA